MTLAGILKRGEPRTLTARIKEAERQVLSRQRWVTVRAARLASNIRQQLTAPASLLLACGVGFILGEITQRQTPNRYDTADNPSAAETATPLRNVLNLMSLAHTLYTALPIAWILLSA